ncbi:MAG: LD-carboxypeptidase [Elainellaceae cyanobacterium]
MFQSCQVPEPLVPGDVVRVISPSGALRERDAFEAGLAVWRSRGYQVKLAEGYGDRWGYLAGTDVQRRQQLREAWADPDCKGILCARGGWGGARLLEDWRWAEPGQTLQPKWLIGFSDITSLLWSLGIQGVSGVHGPLLTTLAAEPEASVERLFDWVERHDFQPLQGISWVEGQATGQLLPANLTVATHLLGSTHQPPLQGVILALEDVGEAPYRIDRMLTQWRLCGLLQQVAGIAVGRFSQCEPPESVPSFSVEEVLRDRLCDLGVPVVAGLPFGHDGENATLPVGVPVTLDGTAGTLALAQNG